MVTVDDPFSAAADPSMPELALGLNPDRAGDLLKRGLPKLAGNRGVLRLRRISVLRHKPGKRCIVEYRVSVKEPGAEPYRVSIFGKTRARRFGQSDYNLQQQFWENGFSKQSADRIAVPEPLGHIPELRMWFQRKVKGSTATSLMTSDSAPGLAARIAEAAVKVHRARVPTHKEHFIADELKILELCFRSVAESRRSLEPRLKRLWQACVRLGHTLEARPSTGIHRDFYSDQILVTGKRLYLIDFDLYCRGDTALDIGNFTGHLTELALRLLGRSDALRAVEAALVERFLELAGPEHRRAIEGYHLLTLARHIYLSTLFEDRRELTEPLLELCEQQFYSTRTL